MSRIAIAMSGGVDSSVAAALAASKYGQENVFGVTMKLFCYGEADSSSTNAQGLANKSCCSLDAINDAATVCRQLGIPHYVVNLEKEFEHDIIDNFVAEYEAGRTPNPCIRCNRLIKFEHLLRKVQELGADILVTGHYARILPSSMSSLVANPANDSEVSIAQSRRGISSGPSEGDPHFRKDDNVVYHLLKGLDPAKDQSYFLFNLTQEQLKHIWFPLGELTKTETRKLAEKYGLKTAQKTESQDICFITTSTHEFLAGKVTAKQGNIVDSSGKVLGKHMGLPFYTIGQRKGLGGGFEEPMYVTGLNMAKNELRVGTEEELYDDEMEAGDNSWVLEIPKFPTELNVKIRYNSEASVATLYSSSARPNDLQVGQEVEKLNIKFHKPQRGITPGQSAVFYLGDEVVGGGIILPTSKY